MKIIKRIKRAMRGMIDAWNGKEVIIPQRPAIMYIPTKDMKRVYAQAAISNTNIMKNYVYQNSDNKKYFEEGIYNNLVNVLVTEHKLPMSINETPDQTIYSIECYILNKEEYK